MNTRRRSMMSHSSSSPYIDEAHLTKGDTSTIQTTISPFSGSGSGEYVFIHIDHTWENKSSNHIIEIGDTRNGFFIDQNNGLRIYHICNYTWNYFSPMNVWNGGTVATWLNDTKVGLYVTGGMSYMTVGNLQWSNPGVTAFSSSTAITINNPGFSQTQVDIMTTTDANTFWNLFM